MHINKLSPFPSSQLLISVVWQLKSAQGSEVFFLERETEEREDWELVLRDEAHCQCTACSERSYGSVKDSMGERQKN